MVRLHEMQHAFIKNGYKRGRRIQININNVLSLLEQRHLELEVFCRLCQVLHNLLMSHSRLSRCQPT